MTLACLKSIGDVLAEIRMERAIGGGSFLVVEGGTDSRFWRTRVVQPGCSVIIAGGRPTAEGAVAAGYAAGLDGILAEIDADFDWAQENVAVGPNIVRTDLHDLETMLVGSPSLDKVLAEYGDVTRIRAFEAANSTTILQALIERALPLGLLRWLNCRMQWSVDFTRLPVFRFLDRQTWQFDEVALRREAIVAGAPIDEAGLVAALRALPRHDPLQVCQGHDLVGALSIALSGVLGRAHGRKVTSVGPEQVASSLRLGYDAKDLLASTLYREVKAWEVGNPPYLIVRP